MSSKKNLNYDRTGTPGAKTAIAPASTRHLSRALQCQSRVRSSTWQPIEIPSSC
ncbi:MAG: hypothetical protein HC786_01770 [Richelia sp. CSU_2_1]|nr:hypothetical protein [Microcoleus sp. SU_5_6]NJL68153.1 hypothetical protein [Microcoleus sp. SM1_3_4]NJR20990.1 hypothetical protein [Richelia sp. CSU_2_1]